MSARDDLVAAMEAWTEATERNSGAWTEFHRACGRLFRNGGGPALLALLDAEPVAEVVEVGGSIAAVRWHGDSLPVGAKLYARPEASEKQALDELTKQAQELGMGYEGGQR